MQVAPDRNTITLRRPSDMHVHFRDGPVLQAVAPLTARQFGQALVMPNLQPKPVTTVVAANAYRERIRASLPGALEHFVPRMTLYLTEDTSPDEVRYAYRKDNETGRRAAEAMKMYPAGATTNSEDGVGQIENVFRVFQVMQDIGMPLCGHFEVTEWQGRRVPHHERERIAVETVVIPIMEKFPGLRVVLEHISTKEAADLVYRDTSGRLGASVTPQHLLYSVLDMCEGGLRPDLWCMPVLKNDEDRDAIRDAVVSYHTNFWAGTDSAPHASAKKYSACCPSGVFSALAAVEAYAKAFEWIDALDERFEDFMSFNGPAFFGLEPAEGQIVLEKKPWQILKQFEVTGVGAFTPLFHTPGIPDEKQPWINWQMKIS